MLHLTTLGSLQLDPAGGQQGGAAVRPRPLALLTVVASARETGIARDKLLTYFWPESDTEHARNCLKQTLFALRRDIHEGIFVTRSTGALRLNPAAITTDVLRFEDARARGAYASAVTLYRGPFLDGFHLAGLTEFEHWMEDERSRLAGAYRDSLEALARMAYEAAEWQAAVQRWRQLVALEPLNSRFALRYMRALVATGSRTEALEFARGYDDLVHAEFGVLPDATVTGYVDWLRRHPEATLRRWHQARPYLHNRRATDRREGEG